MIACKTLALMGLAAVLVANACGTVSDQDDDDDAAVSHAKRDDHSVSAPDAIQPTAPVNGASFGLRCALTTDGNKLSIELTNEDDRTLQVLKANTPLEPRGGNALMVIGSRGEAQYTGPLTTRRSPLPEDYVRIAPNESHKAGYDVGGSYRLEPGEHYTLSLRSPVLQTLIADSDLPAFVAHDCGSTDLVAEQPSEPQTNVGVLGEELTTTGCTTTQTDTLNRATVSAAMATRAELVATAVNAVHPFFITWYGVWGAAAVASTIGPQIKTRFSGIANRLNTNTYNCSPGTSVCSNTSIIAYVSANCAANTVCLCPKFWNSPIWGTQRDGDTAGWDFKSMPQTLMHESSHLEGNTTDPCQGTVACKQLAISNSSATLNCPDSDAYFGAELMQGSAAGAVLTAIAAGR